MMLRLSIVMQMDTCGPHQSVLQMFEDSGAGMLVPFPDSLYLVPHKFPYCCEKVSLVFPHCLKAAMTKQVCFMLQSSLFDQVKAGSCRDQRPHPCLESSSAHPAPCISSLSRAFCRHWIYIHPNHCCKGCFDVTDLRQIVTKFCWIFPLSPK